MEDAMIPSENKNRTTAKTVASSASVGRLLVWVAVISVSMALSFGGCGGGCASCCIGDVDVPDPAGPTGDIRITVTGFPSPDEGRIFLDGRFQGSSGSNNFSRDINVEIAGSGHSEDETFSNQPTGNWVSRPAPMPESINAGPRLAGTVNEVSVTFAFVFGQSGCATS
jgi:hypothetical protein